MSMTDSDKTEAGYKEPYKIPILHPDAHELGKDGWKPAKDMDDEDWKTFYDEIGQYVSDEAPRAVNLPTTTEKANNQKILSNLKDLGKTAIAPLTGDFSDTYLDPKTQKFAELASWLSPSDVGKLGIKGVKTAGDLVQAFTFAGMADRDALQHTIAMMFSNEGAKGLNGRINRNTAERLMELSPKGRDETTTAMWRGMENKTERRFGDTPTSGEVSAHPFGFTGGKKTPTEIDLGMVNPHGEYEKSTAMHELYHFYDELAGRKVGSNGRWTADNGVTLPTYVGASSLNNGAEIRSLMNNLPIVQKVKTQFGNKPASKQNLNLVLNFIREELKNEDYLGRYSPSELDQIALEITDFLGMEPKQFGGIMTNEDGKRLASNGINGVLTHPQSYPQNKRQFGEFADALEASANINGSSSLGRWYEDHGIPNESLFQIHLDYTPEEEQEVANLLRQTYSYRDFMQEHPDGKYIPTYKMKTGGSKMDNFLQQEYKYMNENNGQHSKRWGEVIANKEIGDRHGPLNERDLQYYLDKWKKGHGYIKQMPNEATHTSTFPYSLVDRWAYMDSEARLNTVELLVPNGVLDLFPKGLQPEILNYMSTEPAYRLRHLFSQSPEEIAKYINKAYF